MNLSRPSAVYASADVFAPDPELSLTSVNTCHLPGILGFQVTCVTVEAQRAGSPHVCTQPPLYKQRFPARNRTVRCRDMDQIYSVHFAEDLTLRMLSRDIIYRKFARDDEVVC